MSAKVKVFLADSTLFGSPPEVINFMPPKAIKNTAATDAKITAWLEILEIKYGIQAREVGVFGSEQFIDWARTGLTATIKKKKVVKTTKKI